MWRIITDFEYFWEQKSLDQILEKVDVCLLRSTTAKTLWARKYWHGVAQDLVEKYVD